MGKAKKAPRRSNVSGSHPATAVDPAATAGFRSPVGCTGVTPGEQEFVNWCRAERVRFPSSHLAMLEATGRALVASRAIKMGEVVVEVPDDTVLMADNCSIRDVLEEEGLCKPAEDEILEVQGLIIAVMHEKSRGPESRWAPYLDLLPQDMSHMPLYWKRREFRELRGTAAYDKMMGRVQHPADAPTQVPLLWAEVAAPFIAEHPELGLPAGQAGYELYRWATCAVASYSFILGDDKYQAMVPVWDLLNHITGAVNVRLYHCARRHVLQMIATRDIGRGEELVNNYGELSNAELLRGYGFVEAANRHNHVQVPLSFLVRAAREELQRMQEQARAEPEAGSRRRGSNEAPGPGPSSGGAAVPPGAEVAEGKGPESPLRRRLAARLRLGRRLGLLPPQHVFKVFAGRPPPAAMTALAYLLLAPDAEAAALRAAGRRAAIAAATNGNGRRRRDSGGGAAQAAAAEAVVSALAGAAPLGSRADNPAWAPIVRVYERIAQRMLGRYGSSLEEDVRLAQRCDTLPPRLAAALLARKPEKEALVSLREGVARPGGLHRSLTSGAGASGAAGKQAAAATEAANASAERETANGAGEVEGGEGKSGRGKARGGSAEGRRGAGAVAAAAATGGGQPAADQFAFGFSL